MHWNIVCLLEFQGDKSIKTSGRLLLSGQHVLNYFFDLLSVWNLVKRASKRKRPPIYQAGCCRRIEGRSFHWSLFARLTWTSDWFSCDGEDFEIKGIEMGCLTIIHALKWQFFGSFTKKLTSQERYIPNITLVGPSWEGEYWNKISNIVLETSPKEMVEHEIVKIFPPKHVNKK